MIHFTEMFNLYKKRVSVCSSLQSCVVRYYKFYDRGQHYSATYNSKKKCQNNNVDYNVNYLP